MPGNVARSSRIGLAVCALLGLFSSFARAQVYPSRPVNLVVPFAPGGTVDILGRLAAEVLQRELKQPFVVENRTGAGSVIGNTYVARAAPDGYTLLLAPTAFAIVPNMYKSLSYDPQRDFKPVGLIGYTANVMVVSPTLNVNSVADFIALAKSRPIVYASPGVGTPQHLAVEYFASEAGIRMEHVPYAGSSPALLGIMSGDVSMMFSDLAPAVPLIQTGKLKALAVLTPTRHSSLPDLPAMAESLPNVTQVGWQGVLAPAGTPDAIVDMLNAALTSYVKTPEAARRMREIGVEAKWSTPKETSDWIATELVHWRAISRAAGIKPE